MSSVMGGVLRPSPETFRQRSVMLLLALGLGVFFWPRIQWIARLWMTDSMYSASLLVPFISIVIAYLKRRCLRERNPSAIGLAVVMFAVTATIALDVTRVFIYSATPLLLVIAISGIILAGWGWQALQALAFPVLFLLFLVPIPPAMLFRFDYPLQEMCARVAAATSQLAGIHIQRAGAVLLFADHLRSVDIAPACNGARSTLAMVITAVLYTYFVRGSWHRKLVLLASAVPIAYAANFVRLFGVVAFLNWAGAGFVGLEPVWDHTLGLIVFVLAVGFFFLWARILKCNHLREIG